MKEKMNVGELKRYIKEHGFTKVVYYTDNQAWDTIDNPVRVRMAFTSILMMCHPNIICLKEGSNSVCFERVKYVFVDTDHSVMGTVLDVVCGDKKESSKDRRYTLIAS